MVRQNCRSVASSWSFFPLIKNNGIKQTNVNIDATTNTSLYAMNVMIAAKGLGLETHPMDGFDEGAVKKAFSIPDDKIIPMLIAVGYLKTGFSLLPRAYRRKFEDFVTMNSYR